MIHRPWHRVHAVMYLLTVATFLVIAALWVALLTSPTSPDRRGANVLGFSVVTAMALVGLVVYWLAYLGHQRSAEVRDGHLWVQSWLRVGPLGTRRSIRLDQIQGARLLRPHYVEFSVLGASTRVGTFYGTAHDVDRFGSFWWFDDDYRALEALLRAKGIKTEYRHMPGLGTLLSSR